jgi:hypothetical protein
MSEQRVTYTGHVTGLRWAGIEDLLRGLAEVYGCSIELSVRSFFIRMRIDFTVKGLATNVVNFKRSLIAPFEEYNEGQR